MKKPLVILTGPTASGKSGLSVSLAQAIGGEIISADSMQVYRGMDIGSAKIRPEEMQGVRHHLIDCCDFDEPFNVVRFKKLADKALSGIYAAGHIPVIVGGTGFYIQAILRDIDFTETETDTSFREEMMKIADSEGPEALHRMLEEVDPEAAAAIHFNNIRRTIRALEFARHTGERISDHNRAESLKPSPYNFAYFVLRRDRAALYERIDRRVDEMIREGLEDEVRRLCEAGARSDMISMQGLGYKELLAYLSGECTLEEAIELIKKSTRHYAKRQETWFRREKDVIYLDADSHTAQELLPAMLSILKEKEILQ
ncbi:MAG: tRNA (adenosine(37)-N6)-dimethylallyltransferase MiaA [Lachnospiraceae bacterium]|nr:tRNA (adenosine(37)-N6)-dimethylallyltransferase MiaA [Lachnospiraceae bacterium]